MCVKKERLSYAYTAFHGVDVGLKRAFGEAGLQNVTGGFWARLWASIRVGIRVQETVGCPNLWDLVLLTVLAKVGVNYGRTHVRSEGPSVGFGWTWPDIVEGYLFSFGRRNYGWAPGEPFD